MKFSLSGLPNSPGCYLFFDKSDKIIYIGKAKNLKKRVSSYFLKKELDSKTKVLVSNIKKIDFIVTNTEVEALLLENNLIKKNKPKYNLDLKDSKSFAYIEVINEIFPRLIISRSEKIKKESEKKEIYGPFTSGDLRNQVLDLLNKTFKLRTCKKLPKKKCIRFDIGICSAPCINEISKEEYLENLEKAKFILKGNSKELVEKLKKSMKEYSLNKEFEKALIIREQILSVEYLTEKQNVERNKIYDEDIINFVEKNQKIYLMIFNINKGILENKKDFEFNYHENFFEEFLVQYYSENEIPKKIILPKEVDNSIEDYLVYLKKSSVKLIFPKKGELKNLLELVKKNIENQHFQGLEKMEELKRQLNLTELPEVIECFDISHLGGTEVVGSMVQFRNGKPDKSNYRKFKIKEGDKNDDFRAMAEIIKRRYLRLKKENLNFPNLIVVDGGMGQLNSSINSLNEIGIKIPIVSLAKKFEEIYFPDGTVLRLNEKNKGRKFLQEIRDEAHRFAIKYQRERRHKNYFS